MPVTHPLRGPRFQARLPVTHPSREPSRRTRHETRHARHVFCVPAGQPVTVTVTAVTRPDPSRFRVYLVPGTWRPLQAKNSCAPSSETVTAAGFSASNALRCSLAAISGAERPACPPDLAATRPERVPDGVSPIAGLIRSRAELWSTSSPGVASVCGRVRDGGSAPALSRGDALTSSLTRKRSSPESWSPTPPSPPTSRARRALESIGAGSVPPSLRPPTGAELPGDRARAEHHGRHPGILTRGCFPWLPLPLVVTPLRRSVSCGLSQGSSQAFSRESSRAA